MGSSSSHPDWRPAAQKELERNIGSQLMIPYSIRGPSVSFLAIGTFIGGEFHQVSDLNVNNMFHPIDPIVPNIIPRHITFKQSIKIGKTEATIDINTNWKTYDVDQEKIDLELVGEWIDRKRYGLQKELYVVKTIHTSTNFAISCGDRGIDYTGKRDDNQIEEKIWGYQLIRYKIDSCGRLQRDLKRSHIY